MIRLRKMIVDFFNHFYIRSAPFWDITQRIQLISYRRFGTTYRSHIQGSINTRKM